MQSKGLGVRKSGNVLWIAPEGRTGGQGTSGARGQEEDLRPGAGAHSVVPAELHHGRGRHRQGPWRPGPGSASASTRSDPDAARQRDLTKARTNQLFVTDIPSKLEEDPDHDRQDRHPGSPGADQARIVKADDQFGRSLGSSWAGWTRGLRGGIPGYSVGGGNRDDRQQLLPTWAYRRW